MGLPALQGAQFDAGGLAGQVQPRTRVCARMNVSGQGLAIFEADHSSSPLLKIAATFFDSTSKRRRLGQRTVLAQQLAFELLDALPVLRVVCCGLARASSGSANAVCGTLPPLRPAPAGYTPCSRHHALLPASSIAAVVITASNRAPAVQVRPRAGLDCASERQRSSVCAPHSNLTRHALPPLRSPAAATALPLCP